MVKGLQVGEEMRETEKKKFETPDVDSNTVVELSMRLIEANEKLRQAETERKNILENISHDLRAPLTAIRSTIDLIMENVSEADTDKDSCGKNADELQKLLQILDSRTKTMEVMIQDLYYLTRLENGNVQLELKDIPLADYLLEYFYSIEIDERYRNRKLRIDVPADMDVAVSIDPNKFARVLDNLVSNAWKYSDNGAEIIIGAKNKGTEVTVFVKDNGFGISEEALPHIFDRTYRVSQARTPSKHSGSGLGLSIVKNIVELHGGTITCDSRLFEGSTFTIKLTGKVDDHG